VPNTIRQADDGSYYVANVQQEYWNKNQYNEDYWNLVKYSTRTPGEKSVSQNFDTLEAAKRYQSKLYIDEHGLDKAAKTAKSSNSPDQIVWTYICHDCKIIMWHTMNYCFNCPKQTSATKFTRREISEFIENGYRVGW